MRLAFVIFFLIISNLVFAENNFLVSVSSMTLSSNTKNQNADFPDIIFLNNRIISDKENKLFWLVAEKNNLLVRFDDLDLPVEADKIPIKISFQKKTNTKYSENNFKMRVMYINPVDGSKYTKILNFVRADNFVAEDDIDRNFFTEKGDILVDLENIDEMPVLGANNESFMILGLDSDDFESYSGNNGIFFPTAEVTKQSTINWNSFLYSQDKNKIGVNISTLFFPGKNLNNELNGNSKNYSMFDFKYCFIQETSNFPKFAVGAIITDSYLTVDETAIKNTYTFYLASSKNLTKILNSTVGFIRGDLFNIFLNDTKNLKIKNTDFLFYNMALRLSSNTSIKLETGYDFSNEIEIYSVAYSFSILKNFISFDIGTSRNQLAKEDNNNLFLIGRLKI
jgi:hypothetical protein